MKGKGKGGAMHGSPPIDDDNCKCFCKNRKCVCQCGDCESPGSPGTSGKKGSSGKGEINDDDDNLGIPGKGGPGSPGKGGKKGSNGNGDDDESPGNGGTEPPGKGGKKGSTGNGGTETPGKGGKNGSNGNGDDDESPGNGGTEPPGKGGKKGSSGNGGIDRDDDESPGNGRYDDDDDLGFSGKGGTDAPGSDGATDDTVGVSPSLSPSVAFNLPPSVFSPVIPTSELNRLYETVSCDGFIPGQAISVNVAYQYDITVNENVLDIEVARQIIEISFLDATSAEFVDCGDDGDRRRLNTGIAVSALPKDESCGAGCTKGSMTLYVPEGNSTLAEESQCKALDIMEENIASILNKNPAIENLTFVGDPSLDCEGDDDAQPVGAVVSMKAAEPTFPVVGVSVGLVAAALVVFFSLLLIRRRRENDDRELVHILPAEDPGPIEAYSLGYKDGYSYRMSALQKGVYQNDGDSLYDELPPRAELETNAFVLGFSTKASQEGYCNGFRDGYDAACADLIQTTCDVHKCRSSECNLCRRGVEPQFVPLEKETSYLTCDADSYTCC